MRLVACALVFAIASCNVERPVFVCATWEDCGPGGACEPVEGACSFADDSCTKSGRRFSSLAPSPFNDQCVELRDPAPQSSLCDPKNPKCELGRACVRDRCVSTHDLQIGRRFACARCAQTPSPYGYLICWGDVLGGKFTPAPMIGFGHFGCPAGRCPSECAACTQHIAPEPNCPASCLGMLHVSSYTIGDEHLCWFGDRTYCGGANMSLQLGYGDPDYSTSPFVIAATRVEAILNKLAAGMNHTCSRTAVDRVVCWGNNEYGQLTTSNQPGPLSAMPVDVSPGPVFPMIDGLATSVDFIAASKKFTCAASENDVRCWGTVPWTAGFVAGLPAGRITDLDVGLDHACVIKGGRVVCWGQNTFGQASPATLGTDAPPTVVLDEDAINVATGRIHTCAITKQDGEVVCWGAGDDGQLGGPAGPGPVTVRRQPPALGSITAGDDVTCAIHADDRVRCWGKVFQIDGETFDDLEMCKRGAQ